MGAEEPHQPQPFKLAIAPLMAPPLQAGVKLFPRIRFHPTSTYLPSRSPRLPGARSGGRQQRQTGRLQAGRRGFQVFSFPTFQLSRFPDFQDLQRLGNTTIHAHVYFPILSNTLKNVAGSLPGKGGYSEITLPKALLEGQPKSPELGRIDFYRG